MPAHMVSPKPQRSEQEVGAIGWASPVVKYFTTASSTHVVFPKKATACPHPPT